MVTLGSFFMYSSTASTDSFAEAATIANGSSSFEDLAGRFETLAHEKGGVYAFDVLKHAAIPPNTDMHLLAHRVGDILYKQKGIDGIQYCTQDFRNACSHTIVVGALADFGESALPQIKAACQKAPGGPGAYTMCYHGLGHGVLAYYGYSIPETVALCNKTGTKEYNFRESIECIGGAVMELQGGGGHDRDAWLLAQKKYLGSKSKPLALCLGPLVPEAAKAQCITYLTAELLKAAGMDMGNPDPAFYAKAFALCKTVPLAQADLRNVCYGSFGKEFVAIAASRDIRRVDALADEKYETIVDWCMLAEPLSGKKACVKDVVVSLFWGGENDPAASFRVCSLAKEDSVRASCYEGLAKNISQYVREPSARTELCNKLPEHARHLCLKR